MWTVTHAGSPIVVGTRIGGKGAAAVAKGGVGMPARIGLVDPTVVDMFQLTAIDGVLPTRFVDPIAIVITTRTAIRYPGVGSPIGAQRAVIDDVPNNTWLESDLIAPLIIPQDPKYPTYVETHRWHQRGHETYVRLLDARDRDAGQRQFRRAPLVARSARCALATGRGAPVDHDAGHRRPCIGRPSPRPTPDAMGSVDG